MASFKNSAISSFVWLVVRAYTCIMCIVYFFDRLKVRIAVRSEVPVTSATLCCHFLFFEEFHSTCPACWSSFVVKKIARFKLYNLFALRLTSLMTMTTQLMFSSFPYSTILDWFDNVLQLNFTIFFVLLLLGSGCLDSADS